MDNEEIKETENTQDTPETPENSNDVSTPEDLEAIKAQLEEEKQAKASVEAALAEKDARIAELEANLDEADQNFASLNSQVSQLKKAHGQAVVKYLDAVRLANPTIPQDIIHGDTIEDIDTSLSQAISIAERVRSRLEAQAKESKVPSGAPPRGEISLEGLREKIAAGIQQKGGNS